MPKPIRVEPASIFAQPLEPSRPQGRTQGRRLLTPGITLAVLLTGTCAAPLALARPDNAQNLPASNNKAAKSNKSTQRIQIAQNTGTTRTVSNTTTDTEPAGRRPLNFYTQGVRDSMFSAPQPPKPKEVKVEPPPKPKVVVPPPVIIDPFSSWSYNATVTSGEETMGLLENTQTKEGQWLHKGDTFLGAKVENITDQMMTLTSAGKPKMLAKSDTINVTPLDRSASYLTAQPAQGQPGQTGQPMAPNMPTGQMDRTQRYQQWMQRMQSPENAQRFQQMMDRRFNGGGRNNGGGRRNRGGGNGGFGGGVGGGG